MKYEQNLNVKQNFESTTFFKGSECKRVKVAEVDLLVHLSSSERSGTWASCFDFKPIVILKPQNIYLYSD